MINKSNQMITSLFSLSQLKTTNYNINAIIQLDENANVIT
jgi:hypothetical protein